MIVHNMHAIMQLRGTLTRSQDRVGDGVRVRGTRPAPLVSSPLVANSLLGATQFEGLPRRVFEADAIVWGRGRHR